MAATAVAALALAACGTERSSVAEPPAGTAATPGYGQIMEMVEQSCPPSAPPEPVPTGPSRPLPPGAVEVPPDVEPIAPTAGPEVELNARDWCASNLHEERIAQALWNLADPTPEKVRGILHDLGYADEKIHDLRQSGPATRFFLDLRDKGGRLCLTGTAAGEETTVDKCVTPASGPFTPEQRNL
ncbi:hypothetical protein [Streptomyces sp. NPDC003327]